MTGTTLTDVTDQDHEMLPGVDSLDPLTDLDSDSAKNYAKVGSARPSSLLYTYGPGAIMDLPNFSVMASGLDDWDRIWSRATQVRTIVEPRLLHVVRLHLKHQVEELRPFPWQPTTMHAPEGKDLGIPARVFPQWLRCTACNYLGPLARFHYENKHRLRPDQAQFTHRGCPRNKKGGPSVAAPYLLTCTNGHLDEFPYSLWVHRGQPCAKALNPDLKLSVANLGANVSSTVTCQSCHNQRGMAEAQGLQGRNKIPQNCRGRHPHLDAYDLDCQAQPAFILMGASNLWFTSTQSVIVMPRHESERKDALADQLRAALGVEKLHQFGDQIAVIRALAETASVNVADVSDADIEAAVASAVAPMDTEEERKAKLDSWDPAELLIPEWRYLQQPSLFPQQTNASGLMVTEMQRSPQLHHLIDRVIAVNSMKRITALLGFTRLDEMDRVGDKEERLVKLTRTGRPRWVPAVEDSGEGIFLQLNSSVVAAWEQKILTTDLWAAHQASHERNFRRRYSQTAANVDPATRLPGPRYWLLHSLAHALIREMAMHSGYGAASLSERIYAWPASESREEAAGVLICTTASDSEGTLGGLVALAQPTKLASLVDAALRRAARCSSDPVCAARVPADPEDFLHGAACHCCSFASETSCEKANRFLDRRFLIDLPSGNGATVPSFFGSVDVV